jgi:hypothetical protein
MGGATFMSRLEKGTKVPFMGLDKAAEQELAIALADALRAELGSRSVAKTVARWTGVSDRAVKKWLAGKAIPGGMHLVALMRHSDQVLAAVLKAARR